VTRSKRVAFLGVLVALPLLAAHTQQKAHPGPLEGAWDYLPPLRGQAVYVGNHYMMFSARPDSAPTVATLAEADQAKLYRTLSLQSGTFTIADTIVTMNQTYGKNPGSPPRTWRWSYSVKGDTLTWHVLNAQGAVTARGRSVRTP
jgi:hypothetical protein